MDDLSDYIYLFEHSAISLTKDWLKHRLTVWRNTGYNRTCRDDHHCRNWLFNSWASKVVLLSSPAIFFSPCLIWSQVKFIIMLLLHIQSHFCLKIIQDKPPLTEAAARWSLPVGRCSKVEFWITSRTRDS